MTSRRLVGMTQGARKRAARLTLIYQHDERRPAARRWLLVNFANLWLKFSADTLEPNALYAEVLASYRIGQRLRPCPGCEKCHPAIRRFAPTAGWKSPRKWILWDGAKLWMIARTWRRICTVPTLADYTSGVEDGTWKELFCDGSGVIPAKARKVRR